MGCFNTKHKFSDEEQALEIESQALGFGRLSVNEVDISIRKYSAVSRMNRNQMKSLALVLGIALVNYDTHIYISRLIANLQLPQQQLFNANALLVIGIMLANGNAEAKARALFEVADKDETGTIDLSGLRTLLHLWVSSALDLGLLVGDGQNHSSDEERIKGYIEKCMRAKDRWVSSMEKTLGEGAVLKEHFIKVASTVHEGHYFNPSSFRIYLASDELAQSDAVVDNSRDALVP
jgi:Ca2+-binding EF-hand superfamily protein